MGSAVAQSGFLRRGLGALAVVSLALVASPASAVNLVLNVEVDGTVLGGITFADHDVVLYNPITDTAALLLAGDAFSGPTFVDAFSLQNDGTFALSVRTGGRTLGGLTLDEGDVALYDPDTDTATLLMGVDTFDDGNADVDAVHLLADGTIAFSVGSNESINGFEFSDGDIVLYDPSTGSTSLLFSESLFGQNTDVDSVYIDGQGNIYLSTQQDGRTLAGLSFDGDDIVMYDPNAMTATLIADGSLVPPNTSMEAVAVPEPTPGLLLLAGLLGLALYPRLSRRVNRDRDPAAGR